MSFGIARSIRGEVRACTPDLFNEALDSPIVARVCAEIEDNLEAYRSGKLSKEEHDELKAKLKKRLPIFTFHATFPGGRRKNDDAVPSGLSIYDLDHIANPRARWDEIEPRKEELGIVLAHVSPSTEGLRLVFVIPKGMTLPEAQAWMAQRLGDKEYDTSVKDYARCSFAVPRGYVLWMSEELFKTHPQTPQRVEDGPHPGLPQGEGVDTFSNEVKGEQDISLPSLAEGTGGGSSYSSASSASKESCGLRHPELVSGSVDANSQMLKQVQHDKMLEGSGLRHPELVSGSEDSNNQMLNQVQHDKMVKEEEKNKSASSVSEKLEYHGLDSNEIVQKYWELNNDGLPPTQGDRNTKIFDLACSLRHIFGFDRELLNRAIPNYDGFPQEEKMQCIDNALKEPRKYMPMKLTRVLQALKTEHGGNDELMQALEEVEQETVTQYARRLPKKIGLGVDAALKWLPKELHMQALVAMAPALGALLTRVRLLVHGEWNTLNLQSFIVGEAGSGKSKFARIDAALMKEFYAQSLANQRANEQNRRDKERKRNAKEVPVYDMLPERYIPARHSVAQVLDMLNSNGGLHCYTFAEEADIMTGGGRQAFADTSAIRRVAYDASSYAQAYKSETASRLTIERVLWNLTQCGTPDALYRAFRNFTDGELSRVAIARMPDNTFTPLSVGRTFGERESIPLEYIGRLLPLMQGDVKLGKLEEHAKEQIEEFRLECLKNYDRVAARTRMRIPVTVMRMVCALTLCGVAGSLVEKIDHAKIKPEWAEGAQTAEEYLKTHPQAIVKHITRMQNKEMMNLYDVLAEYLTNTQLYYFRERIEQAYASNNYMPTGRIRRGKNDSVFEKLPKQFDLNMAAQAKGHAKADSSIRGMVHQWCKQELVRNIGNGGYEKVLS